MGEHMSILYFKKFNYVKLTKIFVCFINIIKSQIKFSSSCQILPNPVRCPHLGAVRETVEKAFVNMIGKRCVHLSATRVKTVHTITGRMLMHKPPCDHKIEPN